MKISSKFKVRSIVGENVIIKQGKFGADMTKIISLNETSLFLWNKFHEVEFTAEQVAQALVDEYEIERDREYLMEMYPAKARLIMVMVEDACDKLEYEGSPMFAMYPDRETIYGISRIIYDKVRYNDTDQNLKHMIDVMLCNEFFVRRSRYKRRRKFF